ncbi:MAG: ComEA family DNA-binding protein [Streptomycetaceae bacterium]|nr:MAG: ComEA family DNA-binding protein [Streptomycetaceae bacterium]
MNHFTQAFESISNWWYELHYSHIQKRALLILGALVILFSSLIVLRGGSHEVVAPPIVAVQIAAPEIFIDVTGAVNNPGVYTLAANSRVIDAIKAAGDSAPGADLSTVNLARVLSDGEQIYVDATIINNAGVRISKITRSGPININRATLAQFDSLDGIGPVIAKRIIEYRKVNGPFASVEDLQKVSGIGVAKFANIKSKVRV